MVPRAAEFADLHSQPMGDEVAVKPFVAMTEAELAEFDRDLVAALEAGDDSAARASLASGIPIYYAEESSPDSEIIKEYPDGRKELITVVDGAEVFLRLL